MNLTLHCIKGNDLNAFNSESKSKILKGVKRANLTIPKIMALLFFSLMTLKGLAQVDSVITTSRTFVVPTGVTSITIDCWGGGGGSGGTIANASDQAGGGGGGGAFSQKTFTVVPGQSLTVTVGVGGTAGANTGTAGGVGGSSSVTGTSPTVSITAAGGGGGGGAASAGAAGTAGTAGAAGTGYDAAFAGGAGTVGVRNGSNETGGAGGGGAGNNGPGGTGTAGNGSSTNSIGGAGGAGTPNSAPFVGGAGAGAILSGGSLPGVAGNPPGGGAAGAASYTTKEAGAVGGAGQVVLIYTPAGCTTPSAPTSLSATLPTTTTSISGLIGVPGTIPTGYIIISSLSSTLSSGPVNGTPYTTGTALGGGTVQYVNTSNAYTTASALTSNTQYYLFAYSYNSSCTGAPFYSTTSATTSSATLPLAPTIGTATAGNTQATVTFTAPSGSAALTYTVTSTPGSVTATGSSSPITVTGLTNGTAYTFKVTATNAGGTGAASAASNSVTPTAPCTTPVVPTSLTGGTTTTTTIPGTIGVPGTVPTGYIVISSTSSTLSAGPVNGTTYTAGTALGGGTVQYVNTTNTFTAATSLSSNTQYYLFAYSYNSGCTGAPFYSTTSATTSATTLPLAPTIGTATAGNTQATVTFTAPSGSAALTYTVTSTPGSITATGSSSPITITGLTNGTAYTFKVTATNAGGTGAASAASNSVTPTAPCTTPVVATTLGLTPTTANVTGTFTAPGTAPTNYLVIRTTTSTAPTTPVTGTTYTAGTSALGGYIVSTNTTTGFTDNGLSSTTQYWYWIYSYNSITCTGGPIYSSTSLNGNTTTLIGATFTSSGTFTVPNGVTSITVYSFGGGGGGGGGSTGASADGNGGGGGGGGLAQSTLSVSSGQIYTVTVGAAGSGGAGSTGTAANGTQGGATTFTGAGGTVAASGGAGGTGANTTASTFAGGTGGMGTTGTIIYTGGTGSQGYGNTSTSGIGTGGGGAGSGSNGSSPANGTCSSTGGTGGTGVYPGGLGGYNTSCASTDASAPGVTGALPGGGGSGAGSFSTIEAGGTGGGGEVIVTYMASACTTPSAPGSVTGGITTTTTIPGNITAPGGGATGYIVVSSTSSTLSAGPVNGTTYTAGTSLGGGTIQYVGSSTSFTISSLTINTQYYIFVYSYNSGCTGGSPFYSTASANTSGTTLPGAPTIGTATAGDGQATVTFTAPVGGTATITGYTVTSSPGIITATGTSSPVTITGLTNGTAYTFTVTATNAGGTGAASAASNSVTPSGPCLTPSAPTTLALTPATTSVSGTFSAPGTVPTGYLVIRTTSSTAPTTPVTGTTYTAGSSALGGYIVSTSTTTGFTDNGLSSTTQYWYWIYSYNSTTCSGGPIYSATSLNGNTTTLTPPASYSFTTAGTTTFVVPSGVTAITVQAWGGGGGGASNTTAGGTSSTGGGGGAYSTTTLSGLTSGTTYYVNVGSGGATASTTGNPGSSSWINTSNTATSAPVLAVGGSGGTLSASAPTNGGAASSCTPTLGAYSGGSGGSGKTAASNYRSGGGGGSSAGTTATGNNGGAGGTSPGIGATAPIGGGAGGNGTYYNGTTYTAPTNPGQPGGGGGGGDNVEDPGSSGATGTVIISFSTSACVTPQVPTTLNLTVPSSGTITGTFSAPATTPSGYLVVRTTSSTAPTAPSNGTVYTAGATALGGYIVSTNTTTGFTDNGVLPSTTYWYWIYSYNSYCTGAPYYSATSLSGTITSSSCSSRTLYWAGDYSTLGNNTSLVWATAANWSTTSATYTAATTAPDACTNVVIPLTGSNTNATLPLTANTTIASLTITSNLSAAPFFIDAGTFNFNILGNLSISSSNAGGEPVLAQAGGSIIVGGTSIIGGASDAGFTYIGADGSSGTPGNLYFGGNVTFNLNAIVNYGNLTNATFNSTTAQTVSNADATAGNVEFLNITVISPLTITGTAADFMYVDGGNLTITSGASLTIPSGYALNQVTASTGTFVMNSGSSLIIGGATTTATNAVAGSNFPGGFATYSFDPASSVIYNSASGVTQTIYAPITYGNLTITNSTGSGASTKNIIANVTGIAGNLTVNNFNTLDLSTFNLNRTSVGGTFALNGTATLRLAGVTATSTGTNNFPGNFSTVNLATTSTVEYYGGTQTVYSAPTYGNLTITTAGVKTEGGALNVVSNVLINTGATFAANGTNGINVGGNWTTTGTYAKATETVTFNGGVAQTFNPGTSSFNNIAITNTAGGVSLATNNLTAAGTFTVNGAGGFNANAKTNIVTGLTTISGGTYSAGTAAQTLTGGLTISGGTFTGSTGAVTTGTVTLNSGTLTAPSGAFNVSGNWVQASGSTFTPGTNTVTFNGTGTQALSGTAGITTFGSIIVGGSSILSAGSYNTIVGGSFSVTSGGTFNGGTATQYFSGTTTLGAGTGTYNFNNFTISSGTLTNATYNTNFNISGNWEDDDTYIPGSGTITFNGAADQTITNNNSGQDNFYSITNNKSSGSLVLYNDISLAGTLTLTAGNIDLFGSNLFLSATSPAIAGAPFSATKMIIASYSGSFLIKYATTSGQASYLFPIGDNTGTVEYSPITTTFTAGTFGSNAYIAASVTDGKHPANASTTNYLTRYWNLVRSNITGINAGISATYPSADIAGTESLIKAAQYNGALPWIKYSALSSNTLTISGITTINTIGIPSSLTAFSGITGANPTVAITPLSSTVCQNDPSPVLTANVTGGDPAITYLWSNGATTSSISVPTATAGTTNYTVTITDSNGITATSPTAATVIVNATTVITGNPLSTQTVCQNATPTTLSVTATGTALTYQWYSNTVNDNTTGILISGATSSTYVPSTTASGTVYYYAIVSGTCGTATSTTAAVIVNATTTISGPPTGATYCQNATSTALSVTANGTSVTYQWYSNTTNSNTGGTLISGATSSTYVPSTATAGTVYYYVIVSGTCGIVTSNTATVTVTTPPSATISYSGSPYCSSGGTATVTISGTTGGTYSSTTGLVIDGPSGDVNLSSSTAGTYTVTYTVAAAGGCAVYTTTASITITTAPSGTINYYGSPYCPGTGTATVTSTVNTTGGTYTASPAGLSIDPSTGTVDLSLSLSGTYTVTYTVSGTGGCSTYTVTTMLTIGVDTWTGVTSTDWNDGTNWSCGHVPSINSDAVIPAGGGYYPSVSTAGPAATVHNLTINSGASLTVTSQTLQVSDSINNSGTFDVSIGTLELNGRNPQFIPAGAFTGNKIRNLVISNNVSLNGTDSLTGNLSFGASLDTFSTNGNLTLRSTASRTGSVGIIANGNAISGNVTVERYIATGPGTLPSDHAKSWELLAVPTMGQTINQSWMEGATASNVALQGAGASNPKPGYGTMITSNVANAATFPTPGFDAYTAPGPTVKAYNYATNSYVGPATTGAAVYDQRGWFTFVRGDRSVYTASGAGSTADHTILRTTGTLITPAVSQPVSTVPAGYFQSVGNPFASPVDMTRISATGGMINQYIYVWDPRVGGSYNYGAFVTLQYDGTNYEVQTNGGYSYPANGTVYNYIQNGQAFFMYANAANGDGTVTFPETAKVPDTTFITPFTRQGDGGTVNSLPGTGARVTGTQTPSIRTSLNTVNADGSTGSVVDQVLNQYDDSYSNSVDGYDGRKAANTGENLSINTTGTLLVVEKRHTIVGNDTIFLNLTSERVQAYQFNINASSLSTVDSGFIIDNYLNTRRQLNLKGNTKINFNVVNVAGSYAANRFELVFVALKVLPSTIASVRAYQQSRGSTNINVDWSVSNEHGIQKYVVERSADSVTFTKLTVSKPTANDGSDVSYSVTDSKPLSGTNYYRIRMVDTLGNITYSVIVSVNIGAVKNNIEIYPNPVTDGKIHLQFSNEKAGKYGIRLLDKSGQVISEKQITRQEGNSTELLEWNYNIAHGIYQVEITRPDGSTKNINVLY